MADNFSFTPEQLANTQSFFASNPTPDQIYQVALQNQLSPEQLAGVWSQATGNDYGSGLAAINQYLGSTGKSLSYPATITPIQFTPEQIATTQSFFSGNPTSEQIYQAASANQLSPQQLASAWSQATGGQYETGISEVEKYLAATGKTLPTYTQPVSGLASIAPSVLPARSEISPVVEDKGEKSLSTTGPTNKDIVDYINANINDPVRIAQATTKFGIDPTRIREAATESGIVNAPSTQEIQDYLNKGKTQFEPRFNELVSSTFGSEAELKNIKDALYSNFTSSVDSSNLSDAQKNALKARVTPDQLFAKQFDPQDYSANTIEEIEQQLQESKLNKLQEAQRLAGIVQNIYGVSSDTASTFGKDLVQGKNTDPKLTEIFKKLLKTGVTPEIQQELLIDAADRTPNSNFFQQNPDLLTIYKPIKELIDAPKAPGQYGYYNNAPILSAKEADRLLEGEPFKGGNNYFGYGSGTERDNKLGWDLRSKYAGAIANGSGVFGVTDSTKDINEFDKIEKEITKGGGVQTIDYGEGPVQVVNVKMTDPETGREYIGQKNVQSLFQVYDEYGQSTGKSYQDYQNTKANLEKAASQLGIDASKYSSIKDLYDAVNKKSENLYVVTGKTNAWDPAIAEQEGLTGIGQDRGGINHATVLYNKVGDKLIPVQTLKKFNFDDPNTSRGFFGDLATGIGDIMSIPPIALAFAMAGGLPALLSPAPAGVTPGIFGSAFGTPAASGAASSLAAGLGSSVSNALGLGLGEVGRNVLGNALLSGGIGGLTTGLMTGDLSKAGTAALAGGIGGGIAAGAPNVIKDIGISVSPAAAKVASEILGGTAATAVTGQDPGAYAINRLIGTGISALANIGAEQAGLPTKGPGNDLFKAMIPIIMSKQVTPNDVLKLSSLLSKLPENKVG